MGQPTITINLTARPALSDQEKRFIELIKLDVDIEKYAKFSSWTLVEAICIFNGLDPKASNASHLESYPIHIQSSCFFCTKSCLRVTVIFSASLNGDLIFRVKIANWNNVKDYRN